MAYAPIPGRAPLTFHGDYTPSARLRFGEVPPRTVTLSAPLDPLTGTLPLARAPALVLAASLAPLTGTVRTVAARALQGAAGLPGLTGLTALTYDVNVNRGPGTRTATPWIQVRPPAHPAGQRLRWQTSARQRAGITVGYQDGAPQGQFSRVSLATLPRLAPQRAISWHTGAVLGAMTATRQADLPRLRSHAQHPWQDGSRLSTGAPIRTVYLPALLWRAVSGWDRGQAAGRVQHAAWRPGRLLRLDWRIPWATGTWPPAGISWPVIPGPAPPEPVYWPDASLSFRCPLPATAQLVFGRYPCPAAAPRWGIPLRRIYLMLNDISLVRLPDREPVAIAALRVAIDRYAWGWQLSAELVGSAAAALLEGAGPVEVEATINGHVWQAVVDSLDAQFRFGERRYVLSARGRAVYLSAEHRRPAAYLEPADRTIRQLGEQALVNTGWTLDWQTADWLIPGGVFSHSPLAPLEVLTRLAAGAGAVLQAHPGDSLVTVQPAYPLPPWEWATASAFSVPAAAVLQLGRRAQPGPVYNGVYVAGQHSGIVAHVKRTGTAGELLPGEPIIDALITHVDGARARGLAQLSASGPKWLYTHVLPLSPPAGDIPLFATGQLVEYQSDTVWRGLVTAVQIQAALTERRVTVQQTIEVERDGGGLV